MRDYRMTLAYDGAAYSGWQVQPGKATVQEKIESALRKITGGAVRVVASGRTDAGVHAMGQVASFRCRTRLQPSVLRRALEANTPEDIHIRHLELAPFGFHAIRDAISKRYRYVIQDGPERDLFRRAYSWYIPRRLDVVGMRRAAGVLIGRHDFQSFQASGSPRLSSIRTVSALDVMRTKQEFAESIVIEIEADGFLYNMVRNIVGSLVLVGRGRENVEWMGRVLAAGDRAHAGPTAPPHGLTLWKVRYRGDEESPTA
ncbi:MAG: tRNA pseudouridine(38-40) synthase TruA [Planctomycetota bacterium]